MKRIHYIVCWVVCLLPLTTTGFAQKNLFDKFADMDHVTSVYISKTMFQMMPGMEAQGLNLTNMKNKVESLQVISTAEAGIKEQMKKAFGDVGKQHEELMRIKDGNTRATFYVRKKGELIQELILLADTEKEFSVIQLLGNFTLQDIQEITQSAAK
ncbi:MAG: DUF4252 domain-containing protein [Parabacteroides sp.]